MSRSGQAAPCPLHTCRQGLFHPHQVSGSGLGWSHPSRSIPTGAAPHAPQPHSLDKGQAAPSLPHHHHIQIGIAPPHPSPVHPDHGQAAPPHSLYGIQTRTGLLPPPPCRWITVGMCTPPHPQTTPLLDEGLSLALHDGSSPQARYTLHLDLALPIQPTSEKVGHQ